MLETFFNRKGPPFFGLFFFFRTLQHPLRKYQHPFGGIFPAVQDHIFNKFQEHLVNLIIDRQLACIYNTHVKSCLDGMIKKGRMHDFPEIVIPAERKREIAYPAAYPGMRQIFLYPACGTQEIHGVIVMFLNARSYGENIRIKNDILGPEIRFFQKEVIRSPGNTGPSFQCSSLSFFIKGHDYDGSSEFPDEPGMFKEDLLPLFQTYGIYNTFTLYTFKPGLQNRPSG